MDKRALVLTLDAHRRIRDAKKRAGVALSDVKRAVNDELRSLRASVTPKDEILAATLEQVKTALSDPAIILQFRGEPGKDAERRHGHDGHGIASAKIDSRGHLILVRDDGKELDAGPLPKGKGNEQSLIRLRQKVPDTIVEATLVPAVAFKTANYTVATSDGVILVDTSGGAVTITMPLVITVPRQVFTIKRIAGSANVTIARTGTDVFENGQASLTLTTALSAAELVADADRATYWVI